MFITEILYETYKLFLEMAPYLIIGLIFVGLLNLLFTKDLIIKYIGKNNIWSVIKAALFGVPLPLCSCGVVPSAVYMAKNGASKGSVISFLIATPQTGIDSMIATYGMMGWVFGIFRPIAALAMGIIGGSVIRIFAQDNKEKTNVLGETKPIPLIETTNYIQSNSGANETGNNSQAIGNNKLNRFFKYSFVEFLDDISLQFIIGLIISGIIAYSIPEGFFTNSSINNGIVGMLLMIAVGAPMYVCATASIPIAVTLMLKCFSPGVAFVFLAVGPATNAASFTILMNVLGKKISIIYILVLSLTAIGAGYLLDMIFSLTNINPIKQIEHIHEHGGLITEEIQWISAVILFALLVASIYRKYISTRFKKEGKPMDTYTIKIEGMTCNHCVATVKNAISSVIGVNDVVIDLNKKEAYIKGDYETSAITKAVTDVGYRVV